MGKNDQPALPCAHAHSLIPTAKQKKNILRQYSFFPNQFSLLFETHRKVFRSQFDRIDSFILDVTFLRNRLLQTNHNIVGSGYLIRPSVLECWLHPSRRVFHGDFPDSMNRTCAELSVDLNSSGGNQQNKQKLKSLRRETLATQKSKRSIYL